MATMLLVVRPFNGYQVGDLIADETAIGEILNGAHAHDAIPVMVPAAESEMHKEI